MNGQVYYPLLKFNLIWVEDGTCDYDHEKLLKEDPSFVCRRCGGLPAGRITDSICGTYQLMKLPPDTPPTDDGLIVMARTFSLKQIQHQTEKRADKQPRNFQDSWKLLRADTWALGWFSHWTWDVGQSDADAVRSFGEYVDRRERAHRRVGCTQDWQPTPLPDGYECLMGADDRYRWRGLEHKEPVYDDKGERILPIAANELEDTDPPCRCWDCKDQGVIRIMH